MISGFHACKESSILCLELCLYDIREQHVNLGPQVLHAAVISWSGGDHGLTLFMMMEYGSPMPPQVQTMEVVSAMEQSVLLIL